MLICIRSASKPMVRPSSPSRLARSSAASRIAARVCSPFRIALYRYDVTEIKSNGRTIVGYDRPLNKDFIRNRGLTGTLILRRMGWRAEADISSIARAGLRVAACRVGCVRGKEFDLDAA
ncbi:protein of unknown function [Paraburkholderia kururiensis]